jgi:undecaprenyl diphosphate synthase
MVIPSHIAIIMDGNGRWAEEKGLARREGHKAGVGALRSVIEKAGELGVSCLTVYAFSTENWKRPGSEVNFLMKLFRKTLIQQAQDLFKNNVKVQVIGNRNQLEKGILKTIEEVEGLTANNQGLNLNIAFNYGGRQEIFAMIKKISENVKNGLDIENLTIEELKNYLYTPTCPEVELLIRTGGERRLSNFLLWQCAYAELYFIDKYWPDFSGEDLIKAIQVFQVRERKYGGLTKVGDS